MNAARPPLIVPGQIYLNTDVNEYLIVTANYRGHILYEGVGFRGQAEDTTFIERFPPVDPADIDKLELAELLSFCGDDVQPSTGFIAE